MGREIRKVSKNWEHPKKDDGNYHPMFDESFESAFNKWDTNRKKWIAGEDPDAEKYNYPKSTKGYIMWNGNAPDPEYYRDTDWAKNEACCFQFYETVSEGTPLSPVFETLTELEDWLVNNQGHSRQSAHSFCEIGYAPSMTISNGVIKMGVDSCE